MKVLWNDKDGGSESTVWCYGFELKSLFSVLLLRFEGDSREAYHSHAFNCLNWVLKGRLLETRFIENDYRRGDRITALFQYLPKLKPFIIKREHMHKVDSVGTTYVLSFRGPWSKTWQEWLPKSNKNVNLTHGRKEV